MATDRSKCSRLLKDKQANNYFQNQSSYATDKFSSLFSMQKSLLSNYGILDGREVKDINKNELEQLQMEFVHAQIDEIHEFLHQLPWKNWIKYSDPETRWGNEDWVAETKFELVDQLFFLLNQFILMGMDANEVYRMYMLKSYENFHRTKSGDDDWDKSEKTTRS